MAKDRTVLSKDAAAPGETLTHRKRAPRAHKHRCVHCRMHRSEHAEDTCLFQPTKFRGMTHQEWLDWMYGREERMSNEPP